MGAGSFGLSTGWWMAQFLETISAKVSLTGSKDPTLTKRGPKSRASPTVKEEGSKLACQTLIYDNKGLSTSKALLNDCQVEYTGVQPSIRLDAWSCLSEYTKISDLSTKLRSLTCTTLRFGLNLFPFAPNQQEDRLVYAKGKSIKFKSK